jgi:hypothetical protein
LELGMSGVYRSGSLKTVSEDLAKYKLDLVGIQEIRWDKGGTVSADDYTFFCGNGNSDLHLRTDVTNGPIAIIVPFDCIYILLFSVYLTLLF